MQIKTARASDTEVKTNMYVLYRRKHVWEITLNDFSLFQETGCSFEA